MLFERFPRLETAYRLVERLRAIFRKRQSREDAAEELFEWKRAVGKSLIRELIAVRNTIESKEEYVLNYFLNRSTNASAESLNSKIKGFRAQQRGVSDRTFFMFRLHQPLG